MSMRDAEIIDGGKPREIPTALVRVPFHDGEIVCIQDERGEWIVIKPLCERLGLDFNGQLQRLKRQAWAKGTVCVIHTVASDGKKRAMAALHRKRMSMFLATLPVTRVHKEARAFLSLMQNEAADVLDRYFMGGGKVVEDRLNRLESAVLKLTESVSTIAAALAPRPAPPPAPHTLMGTRQIGPHLNLTRDAFKAWVHHHPSLRILGVPSGHLNG